MLVLASHGIGGKEPHHPAIIAIPMEESWVFEKAMLFYPWRIDNDLGFLIGSSELGGNVSPATTFFDFSLDFFCYTATGTVAL